MSPTSAASVLLHDLEHRNEVRDIILRRQPTRSDARELADVDCERAAIACGLATIATSEADATRHLGEALGALAESGAAGAAAVMAIVLADADPDATVTLSWPDGRVRVMPVGRTPFGPSDWLRCVACALTARDREALAVLCHAPHVDAVQVPPGIADAFWPPLCRAVACVVRGDPVPRFELNAATAAMAPERIVCADRAVVAAQLAPLVPLLRAIAGGGAVQAKLRDAVEAHAAHFSVHRALDDPYGHVSLEALGLASLAHDRRDGVADPRLPARLVQGAQGARLLHVMVTYGLRYAERALDPTGFLDLRGYSRAGRDHALLSRGPLMFARYAVKPGDGMPRASAQFRLADDSSEARPPPALDPGELLLLAQRYAEASAVAEAGLDEAQAATWRANAVDAVDAAIAAIPEGAHAIPASAFTSARGRAVLDAEPGRMRRERLVAYRDALARDDDEAQTTALLSAEVMKASLREFLQAIARDRALVQSLRPRDADYAKVFVPAALDAARAGYTAFFAQRPTIDPPAGSELVVNVAPAGMLAADNLLSRPFPAGYGGIARFLDPHRVWATWRYVAPGSASGVTYDGLVWCDDRWSWFPKPFRVLRSLAAGG